MYFKILQHKKSKLHLHFNNQAFKNIWYNVQIYSFQGKNRPGIKKKKKKYIVNNAIPKVDLLE